jgi:hypothetical protein
MKSILYAILGLAFIVAGIGYYFYSPPTKNILGRALVLMFVNDSANHVNLANQWEKLDLSVEFSDDCVGGNSAKKLACANKHIQEALSRTKNANKSLLLLADKDSSGI